MDEAIHGAYVGKLAQDLYEELTEEEKKQVDKEMIDLMLKLYDIEEKYTEELYEKIGLVEDVKRYVRYNANRALMNLGKDPYFEHEEFSPIVLAGLSTESKTHDFFSQKGNSYVKALNVEQLTDDDFNFDDV